MEMPKAPNTTTTDWRYTTWTTFRDNHVKTLGGSARVVWCTDPSIDVAYVVPTDDDNGNDNALLISLAPEIMKVLLLASTCLNDSDNAATVRGYVKSLKRTLRVDVNVSGGIK